MIIIDPPSTLSSQSVAGLSSSGLARFVNRARSIVALHGNVEVVLSSDAELKRLNRHFRGKNKATDVLSFPAPAEIAGRHAGDLAISLETAARQAEEHGHSLRDEVRILLLHGLLHLSGMDHETDEGEMAKRERALRKQFEAAIQPHRTRGSAFEGARVRKFEKRIREEAWCSVSPLYAFALLALLAVLTLASYVDRVYSEMGKFLVREYQDNVDAWEKVVEPRLRLGRESIALSASVLRQLSLAAIALLAGVRLYGPMGAEHSPVQAPELADLARTGVELVLLIVIFDRLLPQILFTRTRGLWIARIRYVMEALFYLVLPVTLFLGLLLSIAALAEPEDAEEEEHPSEAMDALLEAGEEEGILEESDRELVRSVVEFGDKVVREVMTPRPQIYAVDGEMTLKDFTAALEENVFSRVPVFTGVVDNITGIVFAHDLLQVLDTEAGQRTVAQLQRPAAFVPETKKVNELLREMQREKQHMRIVIDEYGGVAGLITIEDLIEAIVGNIADEHDETEDDDAPVREPDGSYVVSGSFEVSRLRDLFQDQFVRESEREAQLALDLDEAFSEEIDEDEPVSRAEYGAREPDQPTALRLPEHYESTTLGGLVSEIAGHIPLRGEVVEEGGLRLEVLASTDRRIDRIRVGLSHPPDVA